MKNFKIYLLIFLGFWTTESVSQISKGKIGVGGYIGFGYSNTKNDTTNNDNLKLTIQPSLSFYVSEKTALGINLNYVLETGARRIIRATPYVKVSKAINEKLYFNSRFDADGTFGKKEADGKRTRISLSWTPGIEYFLGEKWSAMATFGSVGYSYNKFDPNNSSYPVEKNTTFGAALDFTSSFGLSYYFGKISK